MTVLSSLCSRILLSRLAVQLPLAEASDRLPGLVIGGVDLAMLTTAHSLDRRADLKVLRELRNYVGQRVLLAVDTPDIESDVRVLLPGDRDLSRPHQWALLGHVVQDVDEVTGPDEALQFLVVPGTRPDAQLVQAAVASQPPLRAESLPWFAAGDLGVASVASLVAAGVRRVWLTGGESFEELEEVDEILRQAWREDPAADEYLRFSVMA